LNKGRESLGVFKSGTRWATIQDELQVFFSTATVRRLLPWECLPNFGSKYASGRKFAVPIKPRRNQSAKFFVYRVILKILAAEKTHDLLAL
jgi:hypothetical protein